jgi:excisionase family DNA binding protein
VDNLKSRKAVAEFLGVPERTLAEWAHRGTGPAYHRVGRHTRYAMADVIEWLDANRKGAPEPEAMKTAAVSRSR